jgi:RimJ/RimL family protein N-acetyltransferase
MNRVAGELRLRGWCHYLHWYCDPASFSRKRDEHVHPITEDRPEIWRQWQRWPGPMVGPRLQDRDEIADAFGCILEGKIVSAAQVEASPADFAWEYGVDTLPEYRCRGYATAVARAATAFIIEQGRVPWHYHYNKASRRLPEKTGCFQYGEGLFSAECRVFMSGRRRASLEWWAQNGTS